jgi:hypothetical protein
MKNLSWLKKNKSENNVVSWSIYSQYLKSTTWKNIAKENKLLASNKCEVCDSNKSIKTYHITYDRVFKETQDDLICLCYICHYKARNGCDCIKSGSLCKTCKYIKLSKDN